MRIQQIAGAATAFLFAGLAPTLVMAALWHMAKIAPIIFAFTFAIALGHAVLFGLPLFLVLRSRGWINVMSCVIFGFAIGARKSRRGHRSFTSFWRRALASSEERGYRIVLKCGH
jgi:hypothetical protein